MPVDVVQLVVLLFHVPVPPWTVPSPVVVAPSQNCVEGGGADTMRLTSPAIDVWIVPMSPSGKDPTTICPLPPSAPV